MKTYIVYFNGVEVGYLKAKDHNTAEKKAQQRADKMHKANPWFPRARVSVAYTEV